MRDHVQASGDAAGECGLESAAGVVRLRGAAGIDPAERVQAVFARAPYSETSESRLRNRVKRAPRRGAGRASALKGIGACHLPGA